MNDVEFENYKLSLFLEFQKTLIEVDKTHKQDVNGFTMAEKKLALREVFKKMVVKLN